MRNWQRLGQRGKAMRSMLWFLAGIAILALDQVLSALNILSQEQSRATILVYIVFFLGWYLWPARDQRKYLAREYGNEYTRKRLYVPILFTVAAFVASDKLIPLIQAAAAYLNG
jgi:hypothetical protein